MLFTPNQTLLDGENRYEAGREYDVPEDRARYFVSHGWGEAPDVKPEPGNWSEPAGAVTLQPHDAASDGSSEIAGG